MKKILLLVAIVGLGIAACKKANNSTPATPVVTGKTKVASTYTAGMSVTLWQDSAFVTGYNKLYITLADSASGVAITNAPITLSANMLMGGDTMSCPVEQMVAGSATQMYTGAAVFTMATGSGAGQWSIITVIQNPSTSKQGVATFMVNVVYSTYARVVNVTGSDGMSYTFTLIQPLTPQIGMNNFDVLVDRQVNAMTYIADSILQLQVVTEMPAMSGMTTSNNVNPTSSGNGHYLGKVDLSMTGEWQIQLTMESAADTVIKNAYFEFTF